MTEVLLKYGGRTAMALVALLFFGAWFLLGEAAALGVAVGGILASLNFLVLVYSVGKLLGPTTSNKKKGPLVLLMFGKLIFAAVMFWWVLTYQTERVAPLGLVIGIGAAIGGFTYGAMKANNSPEGEAAMAAEEQRIARELEEDE